MTIGRSAKLVTLFCAFAFTAFSGVSSAQATESTTEVSVPVTQSAYGEPADDSFPSIASTALSSNGEDLYALFITNAKRLQLLDISTSSMPVTHIATLHTTVSPTFTPTLAVAGDMAYVCGDPTVSIRLKTLITSNISTDIGPSAYVTSHSRDAHVGCISTQNGQTVATVRIKPFHNGNAVDNDTSGYNLEFFDGESGDHKDSTYENETNAVYPLCIIGDDAAGTALVRVGGEDKEANSSFYSILGSPNLEKVLGNDAISDFAVTNTSAYIVLKATPKSVTVVDRTRGNTRAITTSSTVKDITASADDSVLAVYDDTATTFYDTTAGKAIGKPVAALIDTLSPNGNIAYAHTASDESRLIAINTQTGQRAISDKTINGLDDTPLVAPDGTSLYYMHTGDAASFTSVDITPPASTLGTTGIDDTETWKISSAPHIATVTAGALLITALFIVIRSHKKPQPPHHQNGVYPHN